MARIVEHHVLEMAEDNVQRCVICGEIITDNRNAMYCIADGPPPRGFAPGVVYVSGKNPTVLFTTLDEGEVATPCSAK